MSQPRGRGRGVGGGRSSRSRAHQGRNLNYASDLIDKRLKQYPNQSFCSSQSRLLCQACNHYLDHTRKSTLDRHLGEDAKQAENSNSGIKHKKNLTNWNERQLGGGDVDYSDIRVGWVSAAMKIGLNASQTANMAKDFFGKYPMDNSSTIPTYSDGVKAQWLKEYVAAKEKIKTGIDKNASYSIIIDETPDRWDDYSNTTLLYTADPRLKPKTLEIKLRESSADNEGVCDILFAARDDYLLNRDGCSSVNVDSTKYNITACAGERSNKIYPMGLELLCVRY